MDKIRFKLDPVKKTLSEDDSKKYFSTVGLAIGVFVLLSYAFGCIASVILYGFLPEQWHTPIVIKLISYVCEYGLAFPVFLIIISRLPKDTNPSEGIGAGKFLGFVCIAFLFMSVGSSISNMLMSLQELLQGY